MEDEETTCMAPPPYLCVLLDGDELQVWVLDVLFHYSVQVWLHRDAVSLVQEIKRGKCILGKSTRKKQHSNMVVKGASNFFLSQRSYNYISCAKCPIFCKIHLTSVFKHYVSLSCQ